MLMQNLDSLQTQIGMPTSGLNDLASDCLRFTMHFFQPIQQSARHIYHSALPLSPKSSIFSSMSLPEQTRISDFYGRPDHWGSVVRTIASIPGGFTCITTIGRGSTATIAAACDDGTVRIYDSVTGVLRLSLRPEFPILEMTGVPDGSLLVCTHNGRPFITLWDIQTGGLVQTFILGRQAKRTTVSLKGRYLACETSKSTVNFWETASRTQRPIPWDKFWGNTPCWLAPEELVMVLNWGSVCIQNVVLKGPPVHKLDISGSAHSAVYSQVFDRLAIMHPYSHGGNHFTILDVKTGTSSTLHSSGGQPSSVAFSQITKQLVCGGETPGLETIDISTGCRTRFDFPAVVTSVSTLSNGNVVANVRGSGIQLLSLDQGHAPPRQLTPPTLTMYLLDGDRIITIIPTTDDRVILLETATMSRVLSIPTRNDVSVAISHTVVLCASLEKKIAVCHFKKWGGYYLQMWGFSRERPRWTVQTGELPSVGSISPSCARLVTFHNDNWENSVRVWDTSDGSLLAKIIGGPGAPTPLNITFNSEDRFYLYRDTNRVPHVINTGPSREDERYTHSITRCAKQRIERQVLEKRYRLDDGHEWVICGSQRICWVPWNVEAADFS